jgi:hypothetical protein
MLKSKRFATGLDKIYSQIPLKDLSPTSREYFRIFDIPDRFYLGKNPFRIRANSQTLVKGSWIYIDIIDSSGNAIFQDVVSFIGEDQARLIVAHIYDNTPPGEATIYIAGRASIDLNTGKRLPYNRNANSPDYIDNPNVIWSKKIIVIPTIQNSYELIFAKPPLVRAKERRDKFYKFDGDARARKLTFTGLKLSTHSPSNEYKFSDTLKGAVRISEYDENVIYDPLIKNEYFESNQQLISPFSDISVIRSENGPFDERYVGGTIIVNGLIDKIGFDKQTISDLGNTVPSYTCSVLEVMDAKTIKVYPSYRFDYTINGETNSVRKFIDATNTTASYFWF